MIQTRRGSLRAKAFVLYDAGYSSSVVAARLGASPDVMSVYRQQHSKARGLESTNHPQKAKMIHKVLQGRKDLRIYEVCGCRYDSREPGICAKAYKAHASKLTSRSKKDGDYVFVTRALVLSGEEIDVLDMDGCGDPTSVLNTGAIGSIRDNGYLFVTWPSTASYRFPLNELTSIVQYGVSMPGLGDFVRYTMRLGLESKRLCMPVKHEYYDRIVRVAFRVRKLSCGTTAIARQLSYIRTVCGVKDKE